MNAGRIANRANPDQTVPVKKRSVLGLHICPEILRSLRYAETKQKKAVKDENKKDTVAL